MAWLPSRYLPTQEKREPATGTRRGAAVLRCRDGEAAAKVPVAEALLQILSDDILAHFGYYRRGFFTEDRT